MQMLKSGIAPALVILIAIATMAGLGAAYQRFHAEESNRRVEIALEWQEVALLSQTSGTPISKVLDAFKPQNVTFLRDSS